MEKFNAATIAHVTGYSVSTVTSWAKKNNKSVKDGLTVFEVRDFLQAPKRNKKHGKVDEQAAIILRTWLEEMGAINRPFELEA